MPQVRKGEEMRRPTFRFLNSDTGFADFQSICVKDELRMMMSCVSIGGEQE